MLQSVKRCDSFFFSFSLLSDTKRCNNWICYTIIFTLKHVTYFLKMPYRNK
ncbi:hypothetical protein HanIR_Chr09g0401591 [Helianthus annuus]|nr:hypothetical protein HanIR_Chr09g0401591 [Helianthus annuus]